MILVPETERWGDNFIILWNLAISVRSSHPIHRAVVGYYLRSDFRRSLGIDHMRCLDGPDQLQLDDQLLDRHTGYCFDYHEEHAAAEDDSGILHNPAGWLVVGGVWIGRDRCL